MCSTRRPSASSSMPKVTSPPTAIPAKSRAARAPSAGSTTRRTRAHRSTSLSVVSFTKRSKVGVGGRRRGLPFYPAILALPTDDPRPSRPPAARHPPSAGHAMKQALTPAGAIAYRGGGGVYLNITNRCSCACEFCLREWAEGVFGESLVLLSLIHI